MTKIFYFYNIYKCFLHKISSNTEHTTIKYKLFNLKFICEIMKLFQDFLFHFLISYFISIMQFLSKSHKNMSVGL